MICNAILILTMLTGFSSTSVSATTTGAATATPTATTEVPIGNPPSGNLSAGGAPGGAPAAVDTGSGAYVLKASEILTGGTYASTNADENAIRAEGTVTATLNNVTVAKSAGATFCNDASSFYALDSAILALDKAIPVHVW